MSTISKRASSNTINAADEVVKQQLSYFGLAPSV